jgi:hypothetical protein
MYVARLSIEDLLRTMSFDLSFVHVKQPRTVMNNKCIVLRKWSAGKDRHRLVEHASKSIPWLFVMIHRALNFIVDIYIYKP